MNNEDYEYTCPRCGNHEFQITVEQQVRIEFTEDGDYDVDDSGPGGDIEWDSRSEACCTECEYIAPLGKMQPEVVKADVVARVVEQIKQEILADVANGTMPYFVGGFRDLQDYVDANAYGDLDTLCGGDSEAFCRFANKVHDQIETWLQNGGIPQPERYISPVVKVGVRIPYRFPDDGRVPQPDWNLLHHRIARYGALSVDFRDTIGGYDLVFEVEDDPTVVGNAVATAIITLQQMGLEVPR